MLWCAVPCHAAKVKFAEDNIFAFISFHEHVNLATNCYVLFLFRLDILFLGTVNADTSSQIKSHLESQNSRKIQQKKYYSTFSVNRKRKSSISLWEWNQCSLKHFKASSHYRHYLDIGIHFKGLHLNIFISYSGEPFSCCSGSE